MTALFFVKTGLTCFVLFLCLVAISPWPGRIPAWITICGTSALLGTVFSLIAVIWMM
jgi:hypothetical protein